MTLDINELARGIVDSLENKKGEDILLLDIQDIASFTSYFIICTGTSNRMLGSLADGVLQDTLQHLKIKGHVEGTADGGWLVLDYGSIVVHLFSPELRSYYRLEELWSRGKVLLHIQ